MGPKNGPVMQRHNSDSGKELSWMDRMQLKLDTLCEMDAGRDSGSESMQGGSGSAFFENHLCSVGTNVRKFCAEFVRELLLPEDNNDISTNDNLQTDSALSDGQARNNNERVKPLESPVSVLEGSSRTAAIINPVMAVKKHAGAIPDAHERVQELQQTVVAPKIGTSRPPCVPEAPVFFLANEQPEQDIGSSKFVDEDADQYAHWFVSEEYRRMRLGKSTSTSSIQSWDGHQRAPSSDSLLDWELI